MSEDKPVIVVGVDFSSPSAIACEAAIELATDMGARLVLVHAYTRIPSRAMVAELYSDKFVELQETLEMHEATELSTKWAARARDKGIEVEVVAGEDSPVDLIVDTAQTFDAVMIVVGTAGHGGFKRFMLGSIADAVIRKAERPVLVVPLKMGDGK